MAVKAVNDTTSPDRLVLILLVYGAYLRISNLNSFASFITDRVVIIRKIMAEIVKLRAKQTVNSALYHCNGLDTTLIYNLLFNSKVLV
jgi:hypothetical protein